VLICHARINERARHKKRRRRTAVVSTPQASDLSSGLGTNFGDQCSAYGPLVDRRPPTVVSRFVMRGVFEANAEHDALGEQRLVSRPPERPSRTGGACETVTYGSGCLMEAGGRAPLREGDPRRAATRGPLRPLPRAFHPLGRRSPAGLLGSGRGAAAGACRVATRIVVDALAWGPDGDRTVPTSLHGMHAEVCHAR
jgi:hypothetical protein